MEAPPAGSHPGALVIIGNFDGVHLGHQAVLDEAARRAGEQGLDPIVLTFDPHPARVLGRTPPALLTRLDRKRELIGRVDASLRVIVERFDRDFAAQSPEAFAERVLVGKLGAREVLVGKNFRFGQGRAGSYDDLERLGSTLGYGTRSHAMVGDDRGVWSSTRVREALARGDLDEATALLGRPHMISGTVIEGDKRGRTIGFPTCNLGGVDEALPPFGVYAVLVDRAQANGHATLARGVANIGVRPTVTAAEAPVTVEVHLLDLSQDLYGAWLRVHLVGRVRPEQKFAGLDELRAQIARDAETARGMLANLVPDPLAGGAWR